MYVEDNPANISLLQRIARVGGHEVINYTSGENALSNFANDDPDLVLMDLQLEGRMGGLDVVKELRERGFKTPIIAVTAYAMVGDRERCIEAGCNSYLSKPLPVAELVELVKEYETKVGEKAAEEKPAESPKAKAAAANTPVETAKTEAPAADSPAVEPPKVEAAAAVSAPAEKPAAPYEAVTVVAKSPTAEPPKAEAVEPAATPSPSSNGGIPHTDAK